MGLLDFFRGKKKTPALKPTEPEWKVTLSEDPYEGKIRAALNLKETGRENEAEILLRQIIEEKQEHIRAWYALAEVFISINEVGRALYCYERILEFQPTNGNALEQVTRLQKIVRNRPDYLWEYNKEKGLI